jgi:hypothetical protein
MTLQSTLPPQSRTSKGCEGLKMVYYQPYMALIAPVNFFLCPREKLELADVLVSNDSFKKSWDGVLPTIAKDIFADPFWRYMDHSDMYVQIG